MSSLFFHYFHNTFTLLFHDGFITCKAMLHRVPDIHIHSRTITEQQHIRSKVTVHTGWMYDNKSLISQYKFDNNT